MGRTKGRKQSPLGDGTIWSVASVISTRLLRSSTTLVLDYRPFQTPNSFGSIFIPTGAPVVVLSQSPPPSFPLILALPQAPSFRPFSHLLPRSYSSR